MLQLMDCNPCSNTIVLCGLERFCVEECVGIHSQQGNYHNNTSVIFSKGEPSISMCLSNTETLEKHFLKFFF